MIESFKHKGLQVLFETGSKKGINPRLAPKLLDILDLLDAASDVEDMRFPGSRLHQWKGNVDTWSVDVTGNWRIIFEFHDGSAYVVDLVDPH